MMRIALAALLALVAFGAEASSVKTTKGPRDQEIITGQCHGMWIEVSSSLFLEADNYVKVRRGNGPVQTIRKGFFRLTKHCVDLDGKGTFATIVEESSGGAHCCQDYHFFTANGQPVRPLSVGDGQILATHRHRGKLVLVAPFVMAYWTGFFADSPGVPLFLTLSHGRFTLDPALHRTAKAGDVPSLAGKRKWVSRGNQKDLARRLIAAMGGTNAETGPLWTAMLELVFTGHADAAWNLFETVGKAVAWRPWNGEEPARRRLGEFVDSLPYKGGLEELNGGHLTARGAIMPQREPE